MSTISVAPDLVGDLAHLGEVDPPRVRRVAGDQHQRPELLGLGPHRVVVEQPGLGVGAVLLLVEHLAADVGPEAVGEVAAGVERHAQQPLVAELVPQRLPVGLGQLVDVLGAEPLAAPAPRRGGPGSTRTRPGWRRCRSAAARRRTARRTAPGRARRRPSRRCRRSGSRRRSGGRSCPRRTCRRTRCPSSAAPPARRSSRWRSASASSRWSVSSWRVACGDPRLDRGDHLEGRVVRGRGGLGQGLGGRRSLMAAA